MGNSYPSSPAHWDRPESARKTMSSTAITAITVVGAGAWGTALALVLHQNGHPITLWGHDATHLAEIAREGTNDKYLPTVVLPREWRYEADLPRALAGAELVVLAVPSRAVRQIANRLVGFRGPVVSVTKGIEADTGLTMCGLIEQAVPGIATACLSGPSLALEVARGIPTAVVTASRDSALTRDLQRLFHRPTFRVYASNDVTGVELGGALKNVVAIAAGVCDGLQFGDNAKADLLTRALAEITRLGVACGARAETFAGLSGLGDLTVTCFSKLSRNRTFGERLGRGEPVADLLTHRTSVVEGYPTARSAHALAHRLGVAAPVIDIVHGMLYGGKPPLAAVRDLLSRDHRCE